MENDHSPLPRPHDSASTSARPASPSSRWAVWISTGFGAGYLPVMPGTYGSAEGVVLYLGLVWGLQGKPPGLWILCAALLAVTALSLWIISCALPHFSSDDPSAIVLDEVAGQGLTLLGMAFAHPDLSWSWLSLAVGFVLFRGFDALKPYPIWKLGHFRGALGVLADDVGAAVAAGLVLHGLARIGWL
jgi:phosphatidylglycerophosphatase A